MSILDIPDMPIELYYPNCAHTIDDIGFFNVPPLNGSGYICDWIAACDKRLAMDVDTIVPGHGPICGKADFAEMRDYRRLVLCEGKKHFDRGMSAGRAALDIDLGKYATWVDSDRILTNVARLCTERLQRQMATVKAC